MPAKALSGPFQINRTTPPNRFCTLREASGQFQPGVHVFAHSNFPLPTGEVVLGLVSELTPFGQGTEFVFRRDQLRQAATVEIVDALNGPHATKPSSWRPECHEIRCLSILLTGGVCHDEELIAMVSHGKTRARRTLAEYRRQYKDILAKWRGITNAQAATILSNLPR